MISDLVRCHAFYIFLKSIIIIKEKLISNYNKEYKGNALCLEPYEALVAVI